MTNAARFRFGPALALETYPFASSRHFIAELSVVCPARMLGDMQWRVEVLGVSSYDRDGDHLLGCEATEFDGLGSDRDGRLLCMVFEDGD